MPAKVFKIKGDFSSDCTLYDGLHIILTGIYRKYKGSNVFMKRLWYDGSTYSLSNISGVHFIKKAPSETLSRYNHYGFVIEDYVSAEVQSGISNYIPGFTVSQLSSPYDVFDICGPWYYRVVVVPVCSLINYIKGSNPVYQCLVSGIESGMAAPASGSDATTLFRRFGVYDFTGRFMDVSADPVISSCPAFLNSYILNIASNAMADSSFPASSGVGSTGGFGNGIGVYDSDIDEKAEGCFLTKVKIPSGNYIPLNQVISFTPCVDENIYGNPSAPSIENIGFPAYNPANSSNRTRRGYIVLCGSTSLNSGDANLNYSYEQVLSSGVFDGACCSMQNLIVNINIDGECSSGDISYKIVYQDFNTRLLTVLSGTVNTGSSYSLSANIIKDSFMMFFKPAAENGYLVDGSEYISYGSNCYVYINVY